MNEFRRQVWHGVGEGIGLAAGVVAVLILITLLTRRPLAQTPPIRDPRLVTQDRALAAQGGPRLAPAQAGRACANPWL